MDFPKAYAAFVGIFPLLVTASCLELPTEDVSSHQNIGLLRQDICGPLSDADRIFTDTGNTTRLFEFPWMALIAYNITSGTPYRCAGSIINERYVLTAAHCAVYLPEYIQPTFVTLGEHNIRSKIDCVEHFEDGVKKSVCAPTPQDIDVVEIIPHPNFTWNNFYHNDIALIRLRKAANFDSDSVRPICLPIGMPHQTENLDEKPLVLSGWRNSSKNEKLPALWKGIIPAISYEKCAEALWNILPISPFSQLCAGGEGVDTCGGDGGSPLVHHSIVDGRRIVVQHGVASLIWRNCKGSPIPAVYTRVGHFMKWILDNMIP